MNSKIIFKPVTEDDFEEILKLEKESFNKYDRLDRETLIEIFSEFSEGFYTLISDGIMAGYSVFYIEKNRGYIESIAIKNIFRRRGFGRTALKFMIKRMNDMDIKEINLHVRFENREAISLYEKEGFVREGIADGFYTDGEPAYLYTRHS